MEQKTNNRSTYSSIKISAREDKSRQRSNLKFAWKNRQKIEINITPEERVWTQDQETAARDGDYQER